MPYDQHRLDSFTLTSGESREADVRKWKTPSPTSPAHRFQSRCSTMPTTRKPIANAIGYLLLWQLPCSGLSRPAQPRATAAPTLLQPPPNFPSPVSPRHSIPINGRGAPVRCLWGKSLRILSGVLHSAMHPALAQSPDLALMRLAALTATQYPVLTFRSH